MILISILRSAGQLELVAAEAADELAWACWATLGFKWEGDFLLLLCNSFEFDSEPTNGSDSDSSEA